MPQISVIMPVYNGADYVRKAIESVLNQTISDWELIVVDDGSTDDTLNVLMSFTDSRISVIQQANQGSSVARNTGLANAQGKYIAFLDADDLYLPNALAEYAAFLEGHPEYDVVYADGWFCDVNDKPLLKISQRRSGTYTGDILEQVLIAADIIGFPVCTLARYTIIKKHKVSFDPTLHIVEDWDFWIYLARWARFGYLDKPLCLYRVHLNNITHAQSNLRTAMLVRNRLKIMHESWFDTLSIATQVKFFLNLLNGHLAYDASQQEEVITSAPFQALPPEQRAWLLRMVATKHIVQNTATAFTQSCLETAIIIYPKRESAHLLLFLWKRSPQICRWLVVLWHNLRQSSFRLTKKNAPPLPGVM